MNLSQASWSGSPNAWRRPRRRFRIGWFFVLAVLLYLFARFPSVHKISRSRLGFPRPMVRPARPNPPRVDYQFYTPPAHRNDPPSYP
jgi:hypothetical protein